MPKLVKFYTLNICSLALSVYLSKAIFLKAQKKRAKEAQGSGRAQVEGTVSQPGFMTESP